MKKMITRRNFLKAAGVSAAALGLAACGGSSSSTASSAASSTAASSTAAKADGKVYYLNFKPEQDQDWQDLAAEYTKETGVPVTVVTAASTSFFKERLPLRRRSDRSLTALSSASFKSSFLTPL